MWCSELVGHPVALLIGVKHIALLVGSQTAGRPHARAHRNQFACRRDFHAPTPPASLPIAERGVFDGTTQLLAFQSQSDVERQPQIAFAVQLRPVGVFVIMPRHAPALGDGEIFIGHAIAGEVPHPRQFGALHAVKRIADFQKSQRLVQGRGEFFVGHVLGRLIINAAQNPHFPLANGDGDAVLIQHRHPADFQRQPVGGRLPILRPRIRPRLRRRHRNDAVIITLLRRKCRWRKIDETCKN